MQEISSSMDLKDHIILCGLGHIGFRVFSILRQLDQPIVVISSNTNADWKSKVLTSDCIFLEGDASKNELLIQAGIKQAKAILALTDQDMVNVSIAIDARSLNPSIKIICRMFDTLLGQHISGAFNVQQVFSTSELAAPIFASSTFGTSAIAQFNFNGAPYVACIERQNVEIEDLRLATWSATEGLHLTPSAQPHSTEQQVLIARKINPFPQVTHHGFPFKKEIIFFKSSHFSRLQKFLILISILIITASIVLKYAMSLSWMDAFYFVITTVTTVGYGDFSFSNTTPEVKLFGCLLMLTGGALLAVLFSSITDILLSEKFQNIWGGQPVPPKDHVIVVGAGNLGARVVQSLMGQSIPIVVIENKKTGTYTEDIKRYVAVVEGDARNPDTLKRAGVHTARAVLSLTEDDVENLGITLAAKKLNSDLITPLRIFDFRLSDKLEGQLNLGRVLSVSSIAAPYFVSSIFSKEVLLALRWKNKLLFIAETVEEEIHGMESAPISFDEKENSSLQIFSLPLKENI